MSTASRFNSRAFTFIPIALIACFLLGIVCLLGTHEAVGTSTVPTITVKYAASGKLTMKQGAKYALGAKTSVGTLSFRSSKAAVASVSKKGVVKAKKTGKATITVKVKNGKKTMKASVKVIVVSKRKFKRVKSVTASIAKRKLDVGQSVKVKTSFAPAKASNKNVLFKSSDNKVATVDEKGVVVAQGVGAATITAISCDNKKKKSSVTVNVQKPAGSGGVSGASQSPGSGIDPGSGGSSSDSGADAGLVTPSVGIKASFSEYSWAELKQISNEIAAAANDEAGLELAVYYNLVDSSKKLDGETKAIALTDNTAATVRILGFRHDDKTAGGKAGISFEFADVPKVHDMNSSQTNSGGWKDCDMRTYLNETFFNLLPSDLKECIASAEKLTNNKGKIDNGNDTSAISTTSDKLWLLSMVEVYGPTTTGNYQAIHNAQGSQYQLYANKGVAGDTHVFCIKKQGSEGKSWWLRSPYVSTASWFYQVSYDSAFANRCGMLYWYVSSQKVGVSPGFCF